MHVFNNSDNWATKLLISQVLCGNDALEGITEDYAVNPEISRAWVESMPVAMRLA